jgi:hypothetical protein
MDKHGISMDVLEENEEKKHTFIVEKDDYKMWRQIVSSVLGDASISFFANNRRGKRAKTYFVLCAPDKAIEIQAKFDFYNNIWREELDVFYSAFVQKNKIYKKASEKDEYDDKELTPEEERRLWKMMNMMEGMDRHHFVKQLPNKKS